MMTTDSLAFCSAGLDRAAALRDSPDELAQALAQGRVLALWRGKPLFGPPPQGLVWLPAAHPALRDASPPVFLGLDDGTPVFAADLSRWEPESGALAEQGFFDVSRQAHPLLPADAGFEDLRGRMADLPPREAEIAATARAILHWHQSHGFCSACGAASHLSHAGWQRKCPACGALHFPRTDPVVIMLITHENSVLLGRNAAWPEGMYSLLAGFAEPGETVEAAVRREVAEETGVAVGAVRYLASQPWPFPANLMLGCRGEALGRAITLDPAELQDALWLTREELLQVYAGLHPVIRPPRKGAIADHLMRNWLADRLE